MSANKTFVGFGLGAVQSGLMLFEAVKSGNFTRYVIIEVNSEIVNSVKNANNSITINTATNTGIIKSEINNIEIFNPNNPADFPHIKKAIFEADEMATAIPSVNFYDSELSNSIAKLLAKNINSGKPQILYTAENNNFAAEILLGKIKTYAKDGQFKNFQIVNTVIGKMGGIIQDVTTIKDLNLDLMVPSGRHAILVEEFNSIIISKIQLDGYKRGIEVFQEKQNLLPFEEAKLYGHNAVHSMLGFFAYFKGYNFMSDIRKDRQLYSLGEHAFQKECGAFLLKKYKDLNESLFTKKGFDFYGIDLLERMTNPFLRDETQRICRDPLRKLHYNDRFLGTIREALKQNITTNIIAMAELAGLYFIIAKKIDVGFSLPKKVSDLNIFLIRSILQEIWKDEQDDGLKNDALDLICSQYDEFKNLLQNNEG
jgi:mannitol-1-phosphate/altronate dehydrogenase